MDDFYDSIAREMIRTNEELLTHIPGSEDAHACLDYMTKLLNIRKLAVEQDNNASIARRGLFARFVNNQPMVELAGKILVAGMVLQHERAHVITTKLFQGINRK